MKKTLLVILSLVLALSCFGLVACSKTDPQATLDMYIFEKDGQTISEDFVLPGTIGEFKATWSSNSDLITLTEVEADKENGIERQYVAKVGLPTERTEVDLTVLFKSKRISKTFTVYVNPLSVYDFSGSYNFVNNNGTVVEDFALDTSCEFKGHTATIAWSVDEEYANYLEISEDGKTCYVYPSSLNPQVKINATFTYNGVSTTKSYRMTVSEQKEPLQEVDYWYTNTGVGIVMSGYVVTIGTVYSDEYKNVTLYMVNDDFTAGYYLYRVKTDDANAALLQPGVHITVTETINTDYNGLMETNAGGNLVVDTDVAPINVSEKVYAVDNDIIGNLQSAYYNQSRLVSLTNWTVKEIKDTPDLSSGTQTLFVLTKGGVDVPVVISKYYEGAYAYKTSDATCSALIGLQSSLQVGDVVSVTGILGNYKGHQIAPLSASAVVKGGTADPEGTVYAGKTAAKAVAAIDAIIAENGLDAAVVALAKNVNLPAELEGCEVSYRIIGTPRSFAIDQGNLVINPGNMERACLTATITVDGFSTTIFRYITAAELDDAGRVAFELEALECVESLNSDKVVNLTMVGSLFPEVTFTWASESDAVVIDNAEGTATFTLPEGKTTVTLVATATLNGETATKSFKVELNKFTTAIKELNAIGSAQAHNVYTADKYIAEGVVVEIASAQYGNMYIMDGNGDKLYIYGLYDGNGKKYGEMESKPVVGDYVKVVGPMGQYNGTAQMKNADIVSFTAPTDLADIAAFTEVPAGKFFAKVTVTEVYNAQYGNMYVTDENRQLKVTVYGSYDPRGVGYADMTFKPVAGDIVYLYGELSTYNDAIQFKNATIIAFEHKAPEFGLIKAPVVGTAYKFGMAQGNLDDKMYYLAGGMNSYYLATTENVEAAIDVYLEATEGGYYLYTLNGESKLYINCVVSGTHVNGAYEATASTVYRYDSEKQTLIAVVNDEDYWFGTRNDQKYTTVGPCKVSYEGFYCKFYGEVIPCAHAETTTTQEDATCTEAGSITVVCDDCGETVSTEELPLADHVASAEWSSDGEGHWHACETCGNPATEKEAHVYGADNKCTTCRALSHTCDFSVKGETVAPTCTEAGYTVYHCNFEGCQSTKHKDEVPETGHTASEDWSSDGDNHWHACTVCSDLADEKVAHTPGAAATCETAQKCEVCEKVLAPALGHKYGAWTPAENDTHVRVCGNDESHKETIATGDLLADIFAIADKNNNTTTYPNQVTLVGVVDNISYAYTPNATSITVDIKILNHSDYVVKCYKLAGDGIDRVSVGDTITATGKILNYYATIEFNGCTLLDIDKHECVASSTWGSDDSNHWKPCSICNAPLETEEHDLSSGSCVCGKQAGVQETEITVSIANYASANGWENGTQYTTMTMDNNISVTVNGGGNSGKYYTSGTNWRLYQSESAELTISAANGKTIKSVKITYVVNNSGCLTHNGSNITSGTVVTVNATTTTFGVGNTGSATNGQARITAIEVIYY